MIKDWAFEWGLLLLSLTSLSHPLTALYYTRLCYALLVCLDSRVVSTLAFRSRVRGFESRLAKKFFRQKFLSFSFFLSFCLSLFLFLCTSSLIIRLIAPHAGQIFACFLGAKHKINRTKKRANIARSRCFFIHIH